MRPLINIDLGELPNEPEELYALADLANVACGGHAGDEASMRRACVLAKAHGTRLGAHPSFPDRPNFGRVSMPITIDRLRETLAIQLTALREIARSEGIAITHVKPHGALYHEVVRSPAWAALLLGVVGEVLGRVTVVGPREGALLQAAHDSGLPYFKEAFADRGYDADGRLLPRGAKGALLHDPAEAAAQALRLRHVETLCIHGDNANAVAIARAVRNALEPIPCG